MPKESRHEALVPSNAAVGMTRLYARRVLHMVPTCRVSSSPYWEDGSEQDMSYYEAALQVLRSARHPLTTREITDLAVEAGLITPTGKTPHATMAAVLYLRVRNDPELLKIEDRGPRRAKQGSVRWILRPDASPSPDPKVQAD